VAEDGERAAPAGALERDLSDARARIAALEAENRPPAR
jgi:hypothetical protein